ncbi:MAG: disulfide bond formation protein B [Patescibacteria group bacterium]
MKFLKENLAQLALLTATLATISSLFFSEVLKLSPCLLCWYQRICMYPLVLILAVCIWKKDKNLPYLVLPLSIIGTIIAIYHNLLYYKIIPENLAPCTLGISCTTRQIEWFGFVTIPLLSLLAFILIDILIIFYKRQQAAK